MPNTHSNTEKCIVIIKQHYYLGEDSNLTSTTTWLYICSAYYVSLLLPYGSFLTWCWSTRRLDEIFSFSSLLFFPSSPSFSLKLVHQHHLDATYLPRAGLCTRVRTHTRYPRILARVRVNTWYPIPVKIPSRVLLDTRYPCKIPMISGMGILWFWCVEMSILGSFETKMNIFCNENVPYFSRWGDPISERLYLQFQIRRASFRALAKQVIKMCTK